MPKDKDSLLKEHADMFHELLKKKKRYKKLADQVSDKQDEMEVLIEEFEDLLEQFGTVSEKIHDQIGTSIDD